MLNRLMRHLSWKYILDMGLVSAGKFINGVLALLTSMVVARELGPAGFGLFTLSLTVLIISLELVGSEAFDNGLVHLASRLHGKSADRFRDVLQVVLQTKLIAIGIFVLVSSGVAGVWAMYLDADDAQTFLAIGLGGVAGAIASIWRLGLAVLQSRREFLRYALLNIVPSVFKLIGILALVYFGLLSAYIAVSMNIVAVTIGALAALTLLFGSLQEILHVKSDIRRRLLQFSKWVFLTNLLSAIYTRMDIMLLTWLTDLDTLGIYSAAVTLLGALDLVVAAIFTILFPVASSLNSMGELVEYLKKSLSISFVCALLLLPIIVFSKDIVVLIYASEFTDSAEIFEILLIGFFFTLMFNPLLLVLYAIRKPHLITMVYVMILPVVAIGCFFTIPEFGGTGAAWVVTTGRVCVGLLILWLVLREIRSWDKMQIIPGAE